MCLPFAVPGSKLSIRAENGSSHRKNKFGHSNRLFGRFGTSQEESLL
jgi:hypothetical protein